MNAVQHRTEIIHRHELHMEAPITARDIGDFVHQVNQQFEDITGRKRSWDDDYTVTGDGTGLTATFETKHGEPE